MDVPRGTPVPPKGPTPKNMIVEDYALTKHTKNFSDEVKVVNAKTPVPIIDEKSPLAPQPTGFGLKLWFHQLGMLYKCMQFEKSTGFKKGLMNDAPGTGKTAVMLALIWNNPMKLNIIVTPPGLMDQWWVEIKRCFGDTLRYRKLDDYSEVNRLYGDKNNQYFNNVNVVLTSDVMFATLSEVIKDKGVRLDRFIIDELDNKQVYYERIESPARFTWTMSASYKSDKGIRCTPSFIKRSIELPEYSIVKTEYHNDYVRVLSGILGPMQRAAVHAGYFDLVKLRHVNKKSLTAKDLTENMFKDCITELCMLRRSVTDLKEKYAKKVEVESEIVKRLRPYVPTLWPCGMCGMDIDGPMTVDANCMKTFHESCMASHVQECKNQGISDKSMRCVCRGPLQSIVIPEYTPPNDEVRDEIKDLEAVVAEYEGLRVLVFSSWFVNNPFPQLTAENLELYKAGDVKVLGVDSQFNAVGLNLQMTDVIVIVHQTMLEEQIIGRAQRPGRNGQLIVRYLNYV